MPATPIEKALAKRELLVRELAETDTFIRLYHEFSDAKLPSRQTAVAENAHSASAPSEEMSQNDRGVSQEAFTQIVRTILKTSDDPLDIYDLYKKFIETGRRVGGSKPLNNFKTKLWRAKDDVVRIDGAGYWLKERPYPKTGYVPKSGVFD